MVKLHRILVHLSLAMVLTSACVSTGAVATSTVATTSSVAAAPTIATTPSGEVDLSPGVWTATGEMDTARLFHTATRLLDGTVLVVGGGSGFTSAADASAERFDAITGSWTGTGELGEARVLHTAILLQDGKVLVVGGVDDNGRSFSSAELYDPGTGSWTTTGRMGTGRADPTATLLTDGTVLVVGGFALASAELYDPVSGTWTPTGDMAAPHSGHTATLLPDGTVLVAGGEVANNVSSDPLVHRFGQGSNPRPHFSAELYDPSTGSWTTTGEMVMPTVLHTATLLPDGTVLVAGGDIYAVNRNTTGPPVSSAQLYDPESGTWTATANMSVARETHIAELLPDGTVLVAGGYSVKGGEILASAERYDPVSGRWFPAANMNVQRAFGAAALLADGRVLVTAGLDSVQGQGNQVASTELYDPSGSR